jgi:thymidylate kinase
MIHISVEGFDGVGKTTAATSLSEKLGFVLVEKPLQYLFDPNGGNREYLRIRNYMNEVSPTNTPLSACFYSLGNIYLYEKFKEQNIVTDRHILSNYAWSGSEKSKPLFDALYQIIGAPTYTFIIYSDEETIYKRLKSRDENDSDLKKIKKAPMIYDKMLRFADEHKIPYKLIETKNLTPEEVVNAMINQLTQFGILKNGK